MNALTPTTPAPVDLYDFDDGESSSAANYAKFDGAAIRHWHDREGALKNHGPYIAANVFPELLRWSDKRVVDRILPEPGKQLPDVDKLNAQIPESEWEEDPNGNAKGPWVKNHTIWLIDPETGAKLVSSNSTVGQRMAANKLKERTRFRRRMHGDNQYPLVKLGEAQFRTSFGVKLRPAFDIVGWRTLGAPQAGQIAGPVESVTASDIVDDSIDDKSPPPKAAKKAESKTKTPPFNDDLSDLPF